MKEQTCSHVLQWRMQCCNIDNIGSVATLAAQHICCKPARKLIELVIENQLPGKAKFDLPLTLLIDPAKINYTKM